MSTDVSQDELLACLRVLEAIIEDRGQLAQLDHETRTALLTAAGRVSRPARYEQKKLARTLMKQRKQAVRAADEATLESARIRKLRAQPVFVTPPVGFGAPQLPEGVTRAGLAADAATGDGPSPAAPEAPTEAEARFESPGRLNEERVCYVCKEPFSQLHHFYDQMCSACGDFNYDKRSQTADLRGRYALVTGARLKIGYQAAIMLLRSGADVTVLTRFPRDAARRYAREPDFGDWGHRLRCLGVDLRHTPSVEAIAHHLEQTLPQLDYVIHNACQTVRRPPGFYQHLLGAEQTPRTALPEAEQRLLATHDELVHSDARMQSAALAPASAAPAVPGVADAPSLTQVALLPDDFNAGGHLFPAGQLDQDEQQVDLRTVNSWRLTLDEVSTVELLEVQLVNQIAPFVLNGRLRPLMARTATRDKHIVNVSAMEGQFYRRYKTDKHPHTNMAKAALNMMTRTSAPDYLRDGIHMNSVDTGWVTDEDPAHHAARKRDDHGFHPPLDIVDGAARIVDPILHGMNTGKHQWGLFLKDYQPAPW